MYIIPLGSRRIVWYMICIILFFDISGKSIDTYYIRIQFSLKIQFSWTKIDCNSLNIIEIFFGFLNDWADLGAAMIQEMVDIVMNWLTSREDGDNGIKLFEMNIHDYDNGFSEQVIMEIKKVC